MREKREKKKLQCDSEVVFNWSIEVLHAKHAGTQFAHKQG